MRTYGVLDLEIESTDDTSSGKKGWRNIWFRIEDSQLMPGPVLWETEEIAEIQARTGRTVRDHAGVFEYLGAFEESS